jgi:hypothetical protein
MIVEPAMRAPPEFSAVIHAIPGGIAVPIVASLLLLRVSVSQFELFRTRRTQ